MRIIFLNSWFGKTGKPFFDFIKVESSKTDIFCFMEFDPELFIKTSKILKNYDGYFEKGMELITLKVIDSMAIFTRKGIEVLDSGRLNIYKNTNKDTGFASYITFNHGGKIINLLNVHGKAHPGHKNDIPARLKQSENIINLFSDKKGPKIIGGDFNLNPDTKSVKMFESAGYKNLIKDFNIKNTRNKLSWKQHRNHQQFADYCFVSPEVKVKSFEVPYMEISDHLPMFLDFEI
jgi:hypothetical protein